MGKSYMGNIPDCGEGWEQIARCRDSDAEWLVYSKAQDHSPDWMTFKIVAKGRVPNKANYWLAKNITTGQIGYCRDYVYMRDNRPELHEQVEEIFEHAKSRQADKPDRTEDRRESACPVFPADPDTCRTQSATGDRERRSCDWLA